MSERIKHIAKVTCQKINKICYLHCERQSGELYKTDFWKELYRTVSYFTRCNTFMYTIKASNWWRNSIASKDYNMKNKRLGNYWFSIKVYIDIRSFLLRFFFIFLVCNKIQFANKQESEFTNTKKKKKLI